MPWDNSDFASGVPRSWRPCQCLCRVPIKDDTTLFFGVIAHPVSNSNKSKLEVVEMDQPGILQFNTNNLTLLLQHSCNILFATPELGGKYVERVRKHHK